MCRKTPVIVIGYNRPDVLSRTLDNLSYCHGIEGHDVFVFIDGPANTGQSESVAATIAMVKQKRAQIPNLEIKIRGNNYGCQRNICEAINEIFTQYDRMCLVEDDVLVSRTFLDYMDMTLDFYRGDYRIFNINSYTPRYLRIPRKYPYDLYLDLRNHTPGWGIWKDRWGKVNFSFDDWEYFKQSPDNILRVERAGCDLYGMIEMQKTGTNLEAWDVMCTYHMIKNELYSVAPCHSLTKNVGFGMTSLHCSKYNPVMPTQKYYNFLPRCVERIAPEPSIQKQLQFVEQSPYLLTRILRKMHRGVLRFSPLYLEPFDIEWQK